ncbi:MAG TPA: ATP synthase F1 subunit gamma [Kofleriaceae bacterium]|jgi:F-type H+-transporting ATPase subunit gamma|nr:ATP synthase F1 subunit gamma [Kofleriaceae bacterium]
MASLKAIRKRIVSVKNTRKITRAMKLVAAAKLRRAQDTIIAARPYSAALTSVVSELSGVAGKDSHPLFEERDVKRAAIVVITADRGLAGAFNTNVIKAVERYSQNELAGASEITLRIIGKKANQHFSRRNANIASYDPAPTSANALQVAREAANRAIADFTDNKVDRVFLAYNEFKNAGSQVVRVVQILPVAPGGPETALVKSDKQPALTTTDYIYEPNKQVLLDRLVPLYVQIQIYRASLESIAAFFGAQMMAMENATKNAGDMINRYTLQYNRARQAAITKELAEIVGGAEALKG